MYLLFSHYNRYNSSDVIQQIYTAHVIIFMKKGKKIIVVMPAHNAEKTLKASFIKLTKDLIDEIILVDDASYDKTYETSKKLGIITYRNLVNLGYGGNLKVCLSKALERNADIIIEYHPDNQYDPKSLASFINKALEGYDFALGSRFIHPKEALTNKMPLIKFIANRALSFIDEFVLGIELSEFHSGFRMYSRKLLTNVSFMQNSDDYLFSFEIIVQAVYKKMRIAEVPISCKYHSKMHTANLKRSTIYALGTFVTLGQYLISKFFNRPIGPFEQVKLVHCLYCKTGTKRLHSTTDSTSGEKFSIHFCNNCKLGFTQPTPSNLASYYLKNYYSSVKTKIYNILQFRRPNIIRRFVSFGKILDVGCGDGGIAQFLPGYEYRGVETSFSNINNEQITLGGIENFTDKPNSYDVVTFWESFEHLKNPQDVLIICQKLLKKSGTIIIECPNFNSRERFLFGSHWFHLDPPRHISHFTPVGLAQFFTKYKFEVIEQRLLYAPEYIPMGLTQSILYLFSPSLNLVTLSSKSSWHKVLGILLVLLLLPFATVLSLVLYLTHDSPILLTVARKF